MAALRPPSEPTPRKPNTRELSEELPLGWLHAASTPLALGHHSRHTEGKFGCS